MAAATVAKLGAAFPNGISIIHILTDGERVLVFTHSGKEGMREAYRFTVDANHSIRFAKEVSTG